jgi:predicted DNA-binding transcriptional regulator
MANDKAVGGAILGGSVIGIALYAALQVYAWEITVRITAFVGVALVLAILAWIGYTMVTTPPPEQIAEIPETKPQGEAKAEGNSKAQ